MRVPGYLERLQRKIRRRHLHRTIAALRDKLRRKNEFVK